MSEQIDPKTREALIKARDLIRAREGKKAAALLHTINHPVARKWEKKINLAVNWSRQPDLYSHRDRGPMPWYLWPFFALAVAWSAGFLFVATGARPDVFLFVCLVVVLWPRKNGARYALIALGGLILLGAGYYFLVMRR